MRRYPLYVQPQMARELLHFLDIACPRRMDLHNWKLAPQPYLQHHMNPTLRIVWSVAARNIGRVRRLWVRAHAPPLSEAIGPITMEDGTGP